MFTNDSSVLLNSTTYIVEDITSDHYPIPLSVNPSCLQDLNIRSNNCNTRSNGSQVRTRITLQVIDVTSGEFRESLAEIDWGYVLGVASSDCNDQFTQFSYTSNDHIKTIFMKPSSSTSRILKPWITEELYSNIRHRNQSFINYKWNPTNENWERYVTLRNTTMTICM